MNPPFTILKPTSSRVPLVLDSPHSGTDYPEDLRTIALARSYDVLIHLHSVTAARLRDR